jgi:hypothetical protein
MENIAEAQVIMYTRSMNVALGGYIRTMKERRGLRSADVLSQLGKRLGKRQHASKLSRVENGKAWPEGEFLTALLDIVRANFDDVAWFQLHPDATRQDGIDRAINRLSQEEIERLNPFVTTDEGQLRLLRATYELTDDPVLRDRIRKYIDKLQSRQ